MRIAVFTKNLTNPAYGAARLGADRAAAALGAEVLHFVPQTPDHPAQQIALIDEALALQPRPDAFVISPVHPTAVDAALLRIAEARIPMVAFVTPVTATPCVSFVSSDDRALGVAIANHLFAHLQGRGRVLMVSGHPGSPTSEDRLRGFRAAALSTPGIRLAGLVAGDYDRGTAQRRSAEWLRVNGPVQGCLVANDVMALGVLDALAEAGHAAAVVGVNAIPGAIAAIADGRMLATADFNAMQIAYLATECAVRHLCGESVPAAIELPVQVVDRANCAQWAQPYERRPVRRLEELRRNA
jgi:ribose transport system substrate-binding protein